MRLSGAHVPGLLWLSLPSVVVCLAVATSAVVLEDAPLAVVASPAAVAAPEGAASAPVAAELPPVGRSHTPADPVTSRLGQQLSAVVTALASLLVKTHALFPCTLIALYHAMYCSMLTCVPLCRCPFQHPCCVGRHSAGSRTVAGHQHIC
jgi:hypothetical protein